MQTATKVPSSAAAWGKWHAWNARVMRPLTEWSVRAIEAAPGRRVLDLASGTGLPCLAIAEAVRPGGHVVATDSAADMLELAERNARAAGLDDLSFEVMDADAIRFDDASFDAVTCSFGLMFLREPVGALREIRRVLVDRGRFAIIVWDEPEKNPFFTTMFGIVASVTSGPPPDPSGPGPFRFAPPGALENAVRQAGFSDVTVESRAIAFEFESVAQHWEVVTDMLPPLRNFVASRSASEVARLRESVARAISPYLRGERVALPSMALCASGRK